MGQGRTELPRSILPRAGQPEPIDQDHRAEGPAAPPAGRRAAGAVDEAGAPPPVPRIQIENEEPQPQVVLALGLFTTNRDP